MRHPIRVAVVTLNMIFLTACSSLNQVHFHRVEPIEPIKSSRQHDHLVFTSNKLCLLVSEGYDSKHFNTLTVGPGIFPLVLPIIPVGLPDKERKHAGFLEIRIQFYAPGHDDQRLTFDPHFTTIEYDDGNALPPQAVSVARGIVSSARGHGQGLFRDPERVVHTNFSASRPIDELKVPIQLQEWSNFHLVFRTQNESANAVRLNLGGVTQNGKVMPMPTLRLSAVSEIRYADFGTLPDGEPLMPFESPFSACRELMTEDP